MSISHPREGYRSDTPRPKLPAPTGPRRSALFSAHGSCITRIEGEKNQTYVEFSTHKTSNYTWLVWVNVWSGLLGYYLHTFYFSFSPSLSRRISDPESPSKPFSPLPTTARAFSFIARKIQHFLPSSTRVELCLPTLKGLGSWCLKNINKKNLHTPGCGSAVRTSIGRRVARKPGDSDGGEADVVVPVDSS